MKFPRSLFVPSHYDAPFLTTFLIYFHFFYLTRNTIFDMENQILTPNQVQMLFNTIDELKAKIASLEASRNPTPISSLDGTVPLMTPKSEKLPDPPMFGGNRKELRPFVTKLRLKLSENVD